MNLRTPLILCICQTLGHTKRKRFYAVFSKVNWTGSGAATGSTVALVLTDQSVHGAILAVIDNPENQGVVYVIEKLRTMPVMRESRTDAVVAGTHPHGYLKLDGHTVSRLYRRDRNALFVCVDTENVRSQPVFQVRAQDRRITGGFKRKSKADFANLVHRRKCNGLPFGIQKFTTLDRAVSISVPHSGKIRQPLGFTAGSFHFGRRFRHDRQFSSGVIVHGASFRIREHSRD